MYNDDGEWREGHTSRWHPWQDTAGIRHTPCYYLAKEVAAIHSTLGGGVLFQTPNMESLIETITQRKLYAFCGDVLSTREFPYSNEMIGDSRTKPYTSRSGNIAAIHMRTKRKSGMLIPAATFKWGGTPTDECVRNIAHIFTLFGFEAPTLASLSEKVLRATLPTPHGIHRPSVMLRRDILNNQEGGRIDTAKADGTFYRLVKEFDKKKAYLVHSRLVPTPFHAPFLLTAPELDEAMEYAAGWWECTLVACPCVIHPIHVDGRNPEPGEVFRKWLWTGEIEDCLEVGYQLVKIHGGYGFVALSNFMEAWSDLLWDKYEQAKKSQSNHVLDMIKGMMVGLPGRFLRQPEVFTLHHFTERIEGDIPLMMHWYYEDDKKFSDYVIRPEYDMESTALSHIGSYIVAEMRRELYHKMKEESEHGYTVIRSYIDCYSVSMPESLSAANPDSIAQETYRNIGTKMGDWTEETYTNVYAESNRFVGTNERTGQIDIKAPGYGRTGNEATQYKRIELLQRYDRARERYIAVTSGQKVLDRT